MMIIKISFNIHPNNKTNNEFTSSNLDRAQMLKACNFNSKKSISVKNLDAAVETLRSKASTFVRQMSNILIISYPRWIIFIILNLDVFSICQSHHQQALKLAPKVMFSVNMSLEDFSMLLPVLLA